MALSCSGLADVEQRAQNHGAQNHDSVRHDSVIPRRQVRASCSPDKSPTRTSWTPTSRRVHSKSATSDEHSTITDGTLGGVTSLLSHCRHSVRSSGRSMTRTSAIGGNANIESSLKLRQPRTRTDSFRNWRCNSGSQRGRDSNTTIVRTELDTASFRVAVTAPRDEPNVEQISSRRDSQPLGFLGSSRGAVTAIDSETQPLLVALECTLHANHFEW